MCSNIYVLTSPQTQSSAPVWALTNPKVLPPITAITANVAKPLPPPKPPTPPVGPNPHTSSTHTQALGRGHVPEWHVSVMSTSAPRQGIEGVGNVAVQMPINMQSRTLGWCHRYLISPTFVLYTLFHHIYGCHVGNGARVKMSLNITNIPKQ